MTLIRPEWADTSSVDLYWLPLGAGGARCVRWSGRLFEAFAARHAHRVAGELYHSALQVRLGIHQYVIEMAPVWGNTEPERGVVGGGPVGLRVLGRSRWFRYEVRRWRNGAIPDIAHAVASPQPISTDSVMSRRLLDLVPVFPIATWGRDDLHTGDMWNSNSLTAWLLARSGHHTDAIGPPAGGWAPGWLAGLAVAARDRPAPDRPAEKIRCRPATSLPRSAGTLGRERQRSALRRPLTSP